MIPIDVPIIIDETDGLVRCAEPIRMGVPFAKGVLHNNSSLALYDVNQEIPCQINTTAYWNDKSVKWLCLDFQIDINKHSQKKLLLSNHGDRSNQYTLIKLVESDETITIDTGVRSFVINKNTLQPFESISKHKSIILDKNCNSLLLYNKNNEPLNAKIDGISYHQKKQHYCLSLDINGQFIDRDKTCLARFSSVLTFYAGLSRVKWDFSLHNPKRAQHTGGLWDLGDIGSIYFKSLKYQLNLGSDYDAICKEDVHGQWIALTKKDFVLYQDSSGGKNWHSKNHINYQSINPLRFKGYQCIEEQCLSRSGNRASPFIHVHNKELTLTAHIKQFWQNFPKAIVLSKNKLDLSLFPEQFADDFELQGGERKTHTIFLDFGKDKNSLDYCQNSLVASIPSDYYIQTNVFWMVLSNSNNRELENLIQAGVNSDKNFFAKREVIDEYGWRNFGDLFADHESLYAKEGHINISHYNNQYDPMNGFAQQFILTGKKQWFELMNDLAQHVVDIDIYRTDDDRHEYNNGLLWHTNHYVDAASCTHRTFSKAHIDEEPDTGGGPGNEHCYTAGLLAHYFMTGSEQSKDAVLLLAQWLIRYHEGNNGVLEKLLLIKQQDVARFKSLIKGDTVAKYQYALHRGTGNYMSTLLDAYQISSDEDYLLRVEKIIPLTLHPNDNIENRHLDDLEAAANWSYTILLQAIIKYLMIKQAMNDIDDSFIYAKECLLHYARWMLENEYPYLEKPEVLEFPNHTWTAQDLRKATIFQAAALFSSSEQECSQFIGKADYFTNYVVSTLSSESTRTYTRIVSILMQNQMLIDGVKNTKMNQAENKYYKQSSPQYSFMSLSFEILSDLTKRLLHFSLKREKKWLKLRLQA